MASLLERGLVVVTGKGGAGKTTVSCALGLLGAAQGKRTLVVELGGHQRLPKLFARREAAPGDELHLQESLWSVSIDVDEAMVEVLRSRVGRVSTRVLTSSSTFRYFAAAAPGAAELIAMGKVERLTKRYDLVVLDAPATGHALGMLRAPQTFASIARVGPLAGEGRRVRELLEDRTQCGYLAVTQGTEMAVTETLELEEQLRVLLGRDLDAVVVNGVLPRRFTREDIARLAAVNGEDPAEASQDRPPREGAAGEDPAVREAVRAARSSFARARLQQNQIARLRRQRFAGGASPSVLTIPFRFGEVDLEEIQGIAKRLSRHL